MRANKYVYTFMTCEPAIALPVPLYHSVIRVCVCVCARARAYMCVSVYVPVPFILSHLDTFPPSLQTCSRSRKTRSSESATS